ncbi:hypothetical protein Esti_004318 [Eimeria stiedai]
MMGELQPAHLLGVRAGGPSYAPPSDSGISLDEPVRQTILRDLRKVAQKMLYVLKPRCDSQRTTSRLTSVFLPMRVRAWLLLISVDCSGRRKPLLLEGTARVSTSHDFTRALVDHKSGQLLHAEFN